ncbi:MAG: hypothetical protein FWD06_09320 [Oscillospiraceae bacterium]|nr:hypothetical protein [Oscillospiraceae bacterium]
MDNLTIEQYKQEMLRQASRARIFDPPAAVPVEKIIIREAETKEPDLPPMVHMPVNATMEDTYKQPDPFFDTTIEAEDIVPLAEQDSVDDNLFFTPEPEPQTEPVLEYQPEPMLQSQTETFLEAPTPLSQAAPSAGVISDEEWFGTPAAQPTVAYPIEPEELFSLPEENEMLDQSEHFPPAPCYSEDDPTYEPSESTTEYYEMPSPVFSSLAEFRASNPAKGELLVHVTDKGNPAAGARVQITKQISGKHYRFYDGYAGRSGSVGPIELPAPRKEAAYHETTIPYALYDITVTHARNRQHLQNVPMFADTAGEQVVRMQNDIPINEAVYVK